MTSKLNLLITGCFNYSQSQTTTLEKYFNVCFMQHEHEDLPIAASDVHAVVCNGLFLHHDIDEFSNLKFIQLTSAGLDRVPLSKIRERSIRIENARGVYSIPMAEWALTKVLDIYKNTDSFIANQKNVEWLKIRTNREINKKNVAVIGAGNVGNEVAKRFDAMGANIVGYDIHTNSYGSFKEIRLISDLSKQIHEFDILIICVPATTETYHLFDEEMLSNMKQDALLVNIARGSLIDETALTNILTKRTDLRIASDVFETEPLSSDSELWKLPNMIISPHNSFVSENNNQRMFDVILRNLKSFTNAN
jgi:phosphoglycerate dehydrogenase-like enzyme